LGIRRSDTVEISPRMWGWTDTPRAKSRINANLPTHVGVDRWRTSCTCSSVKSPHACGGGPKGEPMNHPLTAISPRMWGWTENPIEE
jgi:hypothetical protein